MAGLVIPAAAAHAKALARVQDALGEYHDAAVAEAWLRSAVASGVSRAQAVAVGLLIARQRTAAATELARWERAWKAASGRRIRAWMET
jgi:CHAD domain-containing protein